MSERFSGGFITKTPVVPTTSSASGIWTLDQQEQAQQAGIWPQQPVPAYIEDVFSTWLYTGNGSTQTITNGIDLADKGGLVWMKSRGQAANHRINDTVACVAGYKLAANSTAAMAVEASGLTSFNSNGFTIGSDGTINTTNDPLVSWTFRKQPKFFDVVTYTGNGTDARAIAHSLGATPGCIIIKKTSDTGNWVVNHRSLNSGTGNGYMYLQLTEPQDTNGSFYFGNRGTSTYIAPTSTNFTVSYSSDVNASGQTYVAYLFANNAGGFGLTGTDNVISCGSYTGNGSTTGPVINFGYEPQWLMVKNTSGIGSWYLVDNMRGITVDGSIQTLYANLSNAEATSSAALAVNATGFQPTTTSSALNGSGSTYIYIAIRRGPMKVPTSGTSVFSPNQTSGTTGTQITTGFPVDWQLLGMNDGNVYNQRSSTRLTGVNTNGTSNSQYLVTSNTNAEAATGSVTLNWGSTGFQVPSLNSGSPTIFWNFRRAPSFFDEVCWTGNNGSNQRVNHNLTVVPELIIYKGRNKDNYWRVYYGNINKYIALNLSNAEVSGSNFWGSSAPTTTDFGINCGSMDLDNFNAVAYLFATCAGVSKVGSYTGNGSSQTINCGFTGGARFVLIKRTDSTGGWYVYDTARGMTVLTDPYLLLNSTAAESVTLGSVTTVTTGFSVNASILAAINTSGASYIFLAIA